MARERAGARWRAVRAYGILSNASCRNPGGALKPVACLKHDGGEQEAAVARHRDYFACGIGEAGRDRPRQCDAQRLLAGNSPTQPPKQSRCSRGRTPAAWYVLAMASSVRLAVASPVTRFEQPGPDVTSTTSALPVRRPRPPAMKRHSAR